MSTTRKAAHGSKRNRGRSDNTYGAPSEADIDNPSGSENVRLHMSLIDCATTNPNSEASFEGSNTLLVIGVSSSEPMEVPEQVAQMGSESNEEVIEMIKQVQLKFDEHILKRCELDAAQETNIKDLKSDLTARTSSNMNAVEGVSQRIDNLETQARSATKSLNGDVAKLFGQTSDFIMQNDKLVEKVSTLEAQFKPLDVSVDKLEQRLSTYEERLKEVVTSQENLQAAHENTALEANYEDGTPLKVVCRQLVQDAQYAEEKLARHLDDSERRLSHMERLTEDKIDQVGQSLQQDIRYMEDQVRALGKRMEDLREDQKLVNGQHIDLLRSKVTQLTEELAIVSRAAQFGQSGVDLSLQQLQQAMSTLNRDYSALTLAFKESQVVTCQDIGGLKRDLFELKARIHDEPLKQSPGLVSKEFLQLQRDVAELRSPYGTGAVNREEYQATLCDISSLRRQMLEREDSNNSYSDLQEQILLLEERFNILEESVEGQTLRVTRQLSMARLQIEDEVNATKAEAAISRRAMERALDEVRKEREMITDMLGSRKMDRRGRSRSRSTRPSRRSSSSSSGSGSSSSSSSSVHDHRSRSESSPRKQPPKGEDSRKRLDTGTSIHSRRGARSGSRDTNSLSRDAKHSGTKVGSSTDSDTGHSSDKSSNNSDSDESRERSRTSHDRRSKSSQRPQSQSRSGKDKARSSDSSSRRGSTGKTRAPSASMHLVAPRGPTASIVVPLLSEVMESNYEGSSEHQGDSFEVGAFSAHLAKYRKVQAEHPSANFKLISTIRGRALGKLLGLAMKKHPDVPAEQLSDDQVLAMIEKEVRATSQIHYTEGLKSVPFVEPRDKAAIKRFENLPLEPDVLSMCAVIDQSWEFTQRFCRVAKLLGQGAHERHVPPMFRTNKVNGMFDTFVEQIPYGEQLYKMMASDPKLKHRGDLEKTISYFLTKVGEKFKSARSQNNDLLAGLRDRRGKYSPSPAQLVFRPTEQTYMQRHEPSASGATAVRVPVAPISPATPGKSNLKFVQEEASVMYPREMTAREPVVHFTPDSLRSSHFSDKRTQSEYEPEQYDQKEEGTLVEHKSGEPDQASLYAAQLAATRSGLCFELLYSGKCPKGTSCPYSHSTQDLKNIKDKVLRDFIRVYGSVMEESFRHGKIPEEYEEAKKQLAQSSRGQQAPSRSA